MCICFGPRYLLPNYPERHYYLHFKQDGTKAQRGRVTYLTSHSSVAPWFDRKDGSSAISLSFQLHFLLGDQSLLLTKNLDRV